MTCSQMIVTASVLYPYNQTVCNLHSGLCECPAGWRGEDCKTVQKRPCTNRVRLPDDKREEPLNHTDENGRDRDWLEEGGSNSRCAGGRGEGMAGEGGCLHA